MRLCSVDARRGAHIFDLIQSRLTTLVTPEICGERTAHLFLDVLQCACNVLTYICVFAHTDRIKFVLYGQPPSRENKMLASFPWRQVIEDEPLLDNAIIETYLKLYRNFGVHLSFKFYANFHSLLLVCV